MTERLIVKNFLCLKDIDIEIKDFLILIGPQAAEKITGKIMRLYGNMPLDAINPNFLL
jgi:predicted ATPase